MRYGREIEERKEREKEKEKQKRKKVGEWVFSSLCDFLRRGLQTNKGKPLKV